MQKFMANNRDAPQAVGERVHVRKRGEYTGGILYEGRGHIVAFLLAATTDGMIISTAERIVVRCEDGFFRYCLPGEVIASVFSKEAVAS